MDDFLLDLFDLGPEEFAAVIREQASDAMHPPFQPMRSSTTWPQQGHLRPLLSFAPFSSEAVPNVVGSANESASLSLLGAITALGLRRGRTHEGPQPPEQRLPAPLETIY